MGIYVFKKDVLAELLTSNNKADFGKEVIPDAIAHKRRLPMCTAVTGKISALFGHSMKKTWPLPMKGRR